MLLVNVPFTNIVYSGLKKAIAIQPPLGLTYIASFLEEKKMPVEIIDANAEGLTFNQLIKRIISSKSRYVGFTATTNTMNIVCDIIRRVKKKDNTKIIIVGGIHTTFLDIQTMEICPEIDIIVRNEGEITIFEIMSGKLLKNIDGITYRMDNKIIRNNDRRINMEIDRYPFPARHLLLLDKYRPGAFFNIGISGKKYATMITARGCPNRCIFCSSSHFWKIFRIRSVENIIAEIDLLVFEYGIKHIHFLDDTLTAIPKRLELLCDILIERDYGLEWNCYSRVDVITDRLLKKMKKAGCFGITFGIESGNQHILDSINKNITLEIASKAIKMAKENDMDVHTDFMIGLPEDTEETVIETINFAIKLNPNLALFSITTPFPGTKLFDDFRKKRNIDIDWSRMTMHQMNEYGTDFLSSQKIQELYKYAYRRFYFRFGFIYSSLLRLIRHPREIRPFIYGMLYKMTEN